MYDGMSVSGSEVINVVNKFKNDTISVVVVNKLGTKTYYGYTASEGVTHSTLGGSVKTDIKAAQKIGNASYINPNAQFVCTVLRDINNTIIGIKFVQAS